MDAITQQVVRENKMGPQDGDLFLNGNARYSDCVIVRGESKWKAHKVVLTTRCEFFEACFDCDHGAAESGIIIFEEYSPAAWGIILDFLYTQDLSRCQKFKCQESTGCCGAYAHARVSPAVLLEVCQIAYKYGVNRFVYSLVDIITSPTGLKLCEQYDLLEVYSGLLEDTKDLVECQEMAELRTVLAGLVLV